ncbi:Hypothetical predicted protein [Mytilus galloprovincialis]|uniref:Uncharacterized protein n=1 Tax=Mytilus galloprovincialis TaxID=29158 RepID=A0A8B6C3A4_MYTGA|nr:Hypothetical predicted protein [Mytilus galloprovincialis]
MNILNDHRAVVGNLEKILSLKSLGVTGSDHTKSQSEVRRSANIRLCTYLRHLPQNLVQTADRSASLHKSGRLMANSSHAFVSTSPQTAAKDPRTKLATMR